MVLIVYLMLVSHLHVPFSFPHSHSPFSFSGIAEEGGSREHSFGVITPERTYYLMADSEADKR